MKYYYFINHYHIHIHITIYISFSLYPYYTLIANPPPKTTGNKEWQEATKEILRAQKANPISGISSKKPETKEEEF